MRITTLSQLVMSRTIIKQCFKTWYDLLGLSLPEIPAQKSNRPAGSAIHQPAASRANDPTESRSNVRVHFSASHPFSKNTPAAPRHCPDAAQRPYREKCGRWRGCPSARLPPGAEAGWQCHRVGKRPHCSLLKCTKCQHLQNYKQHGRG